MIDDEMKRRYAEWESRQMSEMAQSWDLWWVAALLVFLVWLAVSSVFSLS